MDIEILGFVQTALLQKNIQNNISVSLSNIHLSIINENIDKNNWFEVYNIWNKIDVIPN